MLSTNIFQNTYHTAEDRLTYNFLCMLDLLGSGQKQLLEFLLKNAAIKLHDDPVTLIEPIYYWSGKGSNPDGCLHLRKDDGSQFRVFLEVKTHRRDLDISQLKAHLSGHCTTPDSRLLVITPRAGDATIAASVDDPRIHFVTWPAIADFLSNTLVPSLDNDARIAMQFIDYAQKTGEFVGTDISAEDITALSQYHRRRPDRRFSAALNQLAASFDFKAFFTPTIPPFVRDDWGRMTIEIELAPKWQRVIAFGIYYDASNHGIPLIKGIPELALFIDIDPGNRKALQADTAFISALKDLGNQGYEENLTQSRTPNLYRLAWWRKPLDEFSSLNGNTLQNILRQQLEILQASRDFSNIFFR